MKHRGLTEVGLTATCIEERQAKAAMDAMPNKTARHTPAASFRLCVSEGHALGTSRVHPAGPGSRGTQRDVENDVHAWLTRSLAGQAYVDDNVVSAPAVQGFDGALLANGATKGVFVTTSRFTSSAYKAHRIVLIDRPELACLMVEHDMGVRTVQTIRVQRIALDVYEAVEAE